MNGHSDMLGMIESGEIELEDFEPPSFDEEKERRAGFFDDDQDKVVPNGNVQRRTHIGTIKYRFLACRNQTQI